MSIRKFIKTRKYMLGLLSGTIFTLTSPLSLAKQNALKVFNPKNSTVLAYYLSQPENISVPWALHSTQYNKKEKVTVETYSLTTQYWPKPEMSPVGLLWQHHLVIYLPETIKTKQALLFVNGGTRFPNPHGENPAAHELNFSHIASVTHSIVVDLQDIPNQYLTFDDHILRNEDSIVAYTWNRYMDDPDSGIYWPIHLPMTKAIIKAMDATQEIMQKKNMRIDYFLVAGASKRGLATWLAALADERINAIIPIVIDILNTKANLDHIYESYDHHWPSAFQAYIDENIPARINTPAFTSLMNIEDPIKYFDCMQSELYKNRMQIPKYIISASGDDFFVPDSLSLYLDKLPGENQVRVVPNQAHYIDMKIVESAILSYYQTIIHSIPRPTLSWNINKAGILQNIITNQKPISVKLWEAENPERRDFRLSSHIIYTATTLRGLYKNDHYDYPIKITPPAKGFKASFIEVTYPSENAPLILTTPTYIIKSSF